MVFQAVLHPLACSFDPPYSFIHNLFGHEHLWTKLWTPSSFHRRFSLYFLVNWLSTGRISTGCGKCGKADRILFFPSKARMIPHIFYAAYSFFSAGNKGDGMEYYHEGVVNPHGCG